VATIEVVVRGYKSGGFIEAALDFYHSSPYEITWLGIFLISILYVILALMCGLSLDQTMKTHYKSITCLAQNAQH